MIEVIPGLYQRGSMLSWPYAQKQEAMRRQGITVVFNLWNKVDPDLSGQCLYVNWPIRGNAMPNHADLMADFAASLLISGERVLVHCEAGVNRSVWFCAAIVARVNHWPREKAMAHVLTRIPRSNVNAAFTQEEDA
jgi:predicted protein tyrosine phosphatase